MLRWFSLALATLAFALGVLATSSGTATAQQTTVTVGDIFFCDPSFQNGVCPTEITAGDTVVWDFSGTTLPHTTTDCGADCDNPTGSPLWDSGIVDADGGTFQFTFSEAGTYNYRCNVHPDQMRGQIIVQAPPAEPAQPSDDVAPAPADDATGDDTDVSAAPTTGFGPDEGSSTSSWLLVALAAAGIGLSAIGFAAYRRGRADA